MSNAWPARLAGNVVIVTGAGNGIGRAEALEFARQGAAVVVNDCGVTRTGESRSATVVEEINGEGGQAVSDEHDISRFAGAGAVVQTAVRTFGRLDVLVNNAGMRAQNSIDELTEEEFDRVVGSHLKGTFGMIKFSTPVFVRQGHGVILNTGSEAGFGMPFNSAYAAAKEGIAGLTRTVARELGPRGVRANLLRPRADTDRGAGHNDRPAGYIEQRRRWDPVRAQLGKYALGERADILYPFPIDNVARVAVWLCTDAAQHLNGYDFQVAGDEIGLWGTPQLARLAFRSGGWTLDDLDSYAPFSVTHGLYNRFAAPSTGEGAPRQVDLR